MLRVHVVSAYNPKNAGMYSVDLAAQQFFEDVGLNTCFIETQRHRLWNKRAPMGRYRTRFLRNAQELVEADALVYWGDFLNNPLYGSGDFLHRDLGFRHSTSAREAFAKWKELFLLHRIGRGTTRVIAASGNFQDCGTLLSTYSQDEQDDIAACFRQNFSAIFPRDHASTQALRMAFPDAAQGEVTTGLDAAFLFSPERAFPGLSSVEENGTFCYFFGRSQLEGQDALIARLARETGLRPVALTHWHKLSRRSADHQFMQLLQTMRAGTFTITDTYHCAINAMTLARPVIGLGRTPSHELTTLNEYKKRTLFQMLGLGASYVEIPTEQIASTQMARISELAATFATRPDPKQIYRELRRQTDLYRDRLRKALLN
jgi:hypothetical protein